MQIKSININNLRNHSSSSVEFSPKLNIIYGENGSGKTTILEAISICGFTKSFLPTSEQNMIKFGEENFSIFLTSKNYLQNDYFVNIIYSAKNRKQIKSTFGDNLTPKDIIGELPQVILSPDFKIITFGSPQDRRSFIDRILSQLSKVYYENLQKIKKILKQRNELLSNSYDGYDETTLEILTDFLVKTSVEIITKRAEFIKELVPIYKQYYEFVSSNKENVEINYLVSNKNIDFSIISDKIKLEQFIRAEFARLKTAELRRGTTLFGPQKDDIEFIINSGTAKEIASQGQHKSILISLKFAELEILKNEKAETPIMLLDDIFSELDEIRSQKVFELIDKLDTQAFITTTETNYLKNVISQYKLVSYFKVSDGAIFTEM
jgi:DNA replication and repair protein RecF